MRLRVLIIVWLLVGGIGLILIMVPKSPQTDALASNSSNKGLASSATKSTFKKTANASSFPPNAGDVPEPSSINTSNWFQRMAAGELEIDLTPEQWAEYFRQNGTNVETLLASQKRDNLKLAAELFPHDPRVQYAVLTRDLFPEQRREWLDRFKAAAPDNALANYLSAREYLKGGDREQGLKELTEATRKPHYNDYSLDHLQSREEAQMAAGRSAAEAKAAAASSTLLPQLAMLKGLSQEVQTMQKEYIAAGDAASAQELAQMGRSLAAQLSTGDGSRFLINQLVGAAIERIVLSPLPPDSQPEFLDGTVQQRLDEMTAFRQSVRTLTPQADEMMARGDEREIINYFDRLKLQGEYKALLWLQSRRSPR